MVKDTSLRVLLLVNELYHQNYIDDMTKKWLCLTPNPPRGPVFYTLTKIHKPNPVGRPIISDCDGPTERLSSFVDRLLQPIAQKQKSYLKDTTDFINLIETTRVPKMQSLSRWTWLAYTQIYLRRRELRQCARHTTLSIKTALPSLHSILKERLNLSFKRTHSSLMEKTTCKHMELPWPPRWR